jgi:hypothetical protein
MTIHTNELPITGLLSRTEQSLANFAKYMPTHQHRLCARKYADFHFFLPCRPVVPGGRPERNEQNSEARQKM